MDSSDDDDKSLSSSSSEDDRKRRRKLKKSKHSKKEKKSKKSKKRSRRRSSSSDDSSSEGEATWVEAKMPEKEMESKKPSKKKKSVKEDLVEPSTSSKTKEEEDDEWSEFGNVLPTFSNDSKRKKRQDLREEQRMLSSIDTAGQNERELNPYWKNGGKGLPTEEEKPKVTSSVGDGGLAWLKKSFQRAKQQAADEGKDLEEIVAERWGSLEEFYTLLEEAERKAGGGNSTSSRGRDRRDDDRDRDRGRGKSFKRPSRYSDSDDDQRSSSHRRDERDRDRDSSRRQHHSHRDDRGRDRDREREQNRPMSWRKPGMEPEKKPDSSSSKPSSSSNRVPVTAQVSSISKQEQMEVDEEEEEKPEETKPAVLTDKEMNELNAKILKAELMGDEERISELKLKLSEAQQAREEYIKSGKVPGQETKIITKVIIGSQSKRRTKDKPLESHKEGQRIRYFPDDDKYSLKSMFEKEKTNTAEDENALFAKMMGKVTKASEDYNVDDIFVDKASSSRQASKDQKREIQNVLNEEKFANKVLADCPWCFDGKHLQKNLIVSIGQTCFLCVPPFQSLTEGHCLIVPMSHVTCATELDEDVWSEIQKFKTALVRMFFQSEDDIVFFERAVFLKRQPHMYIECVPMPKETGELAPIYFKKAIQECETEWAQNKKVIDLKKGGVRRSVPKGLPYFSVEFGEDYSCGFAHVIEDERNFPNNFAQEIIGGMMELDHQIWRKQKQEDFNKQRDKLMKFITAWAPFDFTKEGK